MSSILFKSLLQNNKLTINIFKKTLPDIGKSIIYLKNNYGCLNYLFINNLFRNQQYGSLLLLKSEDILKHKYNINYLNLCAWEIQGQYKIQHFYTKNNYIIKDNSLNYFDDGVNIYELIHMYKYLK